MSTKNAARAFLRDALGGAVNEREIITGALSGKGFVRRAAGGRRSVDVAMAGQASSIVPSLRGEAAGPPQIKLRRYFLEPSNTVGKEKISSAAYGVDMDRKSFEALVGKTAAETGKEGRNAVQATITSSLDDAGRRQQQLDASQEERIDIKTPDGTVKGLSRGRDQYRVDDFSLKQAPDREEPQRDRDPRLERVKERARQIFEREEARKRAKTKSSGKGDQEIGD